MFLMFYLFRLLELMYKYKNILEINLSKKDIITNLYINLHILCLINEITPHLIINRSIGLFSSS